jgi:hypothetical protein
MWVRWSSAGSTLSSASSTCDVNQQWGTLFWRESIGEEYWLQSRTGGPDRTCYLPTTWQILQAYSLSVEQLC